LTQALPVEMNLALLHFLWILVSGALFSVLKPIELSDAITHRPGCARQFVCNRENIQHLPELTLLGGSILNFLATTTAPTEVIGFWDRKPKRIPGRFRHISMSRTFSKDVELRSVGMHFVHFFIAHSDCSIGGK
jgi:hypothetical protein